MQGAHQENIVQKDEHIDTLIPRNNRFGGSGLCETLIVSE